MTETPKQERTQASGAASDCNDLLAADLHQTTDAAVWAREFVKLHGGDEELMLAWFSNAIMRGYDEAQSTGPDVRRLAWIAGELCDNIGDIDLHEEAAINMVVFGRDEPNQGDYAAAVRTAIDAAMQAANAEIEVRDDQS